MEVGDKLNHKDLLGKDLPLNVYDNISKIKQSLYDRS